ncbi:hypothetical protein Tco_0303763 [Tanacetum coccineum]
MVRPILRDRLAIEFSKSRTNSQAEIISEEQLVLHVKNNQRVAPDSHITDTMLRFTLGYDEDPETKMIAISKMVATRLHQPWRAILSVLNRMGSEKAKIVDEPEEQHVSPVKSGRGKGFMCYGDQVTNVSNKLKKDVVPRKTRSPTIAEETLVVTDTYAEWGQKLKGPAVDDPAVRSLLDLQKGSNASRLESLKQKKQAVTREESSAARNKYYDSSNTDSDAIFYSPSSDKTEKSANETDDADDSDMDLYDDNPEGDDDAAGSSLDFIQTLLDETPANELTDFMSHPVYTNAQTTSMVHNPEGNPELTSYISGASKVPLGTHVDVLATKTLLQEMFPNENAHHIPSLPANNIPYNATTSQPSSLQAKAKKLMRRTGRNVVRMSANLLLDHQEKKLKAIIQKDELTIADLEGAGPERLKQQYQNDVELEYHVDQLKAAVLSEAKWNSDEDDMSKPRTKETHRYIFEALNGIHHWEDSRIDFFKAEMSTRTEGSVYSDLRIKSVVRVVVNNKWGYGFLSAFVVRRSDDKEYKFSYAYHPRLSLNDVEDMYLIQVQDKLHHLPLEFVKDFNNALFLFIKRVVIQNRVEDIQLGVESYQQTLNLTKPMMFFERIDQRIPFTMSGTHKGVVYLNQHNVKSFMKLSKVKKFYDGTLLKIRKNLVDMLKRNKLGTGNKRLKGRD